MIATERLTLRPWHDGDVAPFYAMGQDAEVMRYLGPPASRQDCERAIARMAVAQSAVGHCFWAVERHTDGAFIGFCGLMPCKPPLLGEIEIGWRLARAAWGQGYALEAAKASLEWAWNHLDVESIVAMTVPANRRSWGLMERLGMSRVPGGDFDHPDLPLGNPLRHHILYRIARPTNG